MKPCIIAVFIFFISGCTSTLKYIEQDPPPYANQTTWTDQNGSDVFVVNAKQYPKEFLILVNSGKFRIVADPDAPNVTLNPLGGPYACGMPLLVSVFTLGLVPSSTLGPYSYSFTLNDSGVRTECEYRLVPEIRFSLWEWFRKPFVDEAGVLGECLRHTGQKTCRKRT